MANISGNNSVPDGSGIIYATPDMGNSELDDLNVEVYNEADIEQKVTKDIQREEAKAIVHETENQLRTIEEKLDVVLKQVNSCENALQNICENGGFNSRKCRTLLNEQERLATKRADLLEKKLEAQSKRDKAMVISELDESNFTKQAKNSNLTTNVPQTSIFLSQFQEPALNSSSPAEICEAQDVSGMRKETEQEKNIRLGKLTSFGNVLKSKRGNLKDDQDTEDNNTSAFYKQLQNEQRSERYSKKNRKELREPGNKLVLDRKRPITCKDDNILSKRTKVNRPWAGVECSKVSDALSSEGVNNKTHDKHFGKADWNSEDSDWLSSSDDDNKLSLKSKRTSKLNKNGLERVLDDGDRQEYIHRLEQWHDNRTEEDLYSDSLYEEIEGGLRIPMVIWSRLYHYQRVCVQWLWELDQQKVGGILGDEMGLGKTIQIIAYLASLAFSQKKLHRKQIGLILIVCPTTIMHQWVREFHRWWPPFRVSVLHGSGSYNGSKISLIREVADSSSRASILVTSYSGVTNYQEALHKESFDYIILDEGHKIRNPDAQITLAVKQFSTSHRIILSGSPLQNNLKELWSLFDFIYPGKLGTLPVFLQQFSVPITIGGYSNANKTQVATAYKCATVLRDTINPYLLRRLKTDVNNHINLPAKSDQVLFCRLTEEQRKLYREYLSGVEVKNILDGHIKVFAGLMTLRKLCNHPDLYDCRPKHLGVPTTEENENEYYDFGYWKKSGKMIVIEGLLKLWKKQDHKVLLFSQSKQMLLILQKFVKSKGYTYMKMDGQTPIGSRQNLIDEFNEKSDIFVFLLTTKVGGLGINLTGASRVVIFDPDWNPSTDTQARERAWRIGQHKEVTIYRLLTSGTIEEKIYHRQIFKQLLINRVLKDPTQKRFFKSSDLYDLFTLNEGTSDETETSAIFAGTGSEVKVKSSRHLKKVKVETKIVEKMLRDEARPVNLRSKETKMHDNTLSLREKVKLISQKISLRKMQKDSEGIPNLPVKEKTGYGKSTSHKTENIQITGRNTNDPNGTNTVEACTSYSRLSKKNEKHRDHKRHKRTLKKGSKFEGHRVSHLVKSDKLGGNRDSSSSETKVTNTGKGEEQDSYVLSKLFKKSGVHSAVKHDMIVEGGGADFALIEGEAERVAKDAVNKLKESRRLCFRADAGLPTWTGSNGVMAKPLNSLSKQQRFGKKSKLSPNNHLNGETPNQHKLTAQELLYRMRRRNGLISANESSTGQFNETALFQPDSVNDNMELLADIRNFIAFQCDSLVDGEATTDQLINKFKDKLPPRRNPLFKALLNEICSMYRDSKGHGVWRLKPEFR